MIWVRVLGKENAITGDVFVTLDLLVKLVPHRWAVQAIVLAMGAAIVDGVNVKLVLWVAVAIRLN